MSEPAITLAEVERFEATVPPVSSSASRFASSVALTLATRLLMLAGVVGSSILVARRLGPEGFGTLAVSLVVMTTFVTIPSKPPSAITLSNS